MSKHTFFMTFLTHARKKSHYSKWKQIQNNVHNVYNAPHPPFRLWALGR